MTIVRMKTFTADIIMRAYRYLRSDKFNFVFAGLFLVLLVANIILTT